MSALSTTEKARFEKLETEIQDNQDGFIRVGKALAEIRDSKLYKGEFASFAVYCEKRWGFSKSHAYRMIEGADLDLDVFPMGDSFQSKVKVGNERQAREVAKVEPAKRKEVIEKATAKASEESKPVTAKHIKEAAAEVEVVKDETGAVIEHPEIRAIFLRRPVITEMMRGISTLKSNVMKAIDGKDVLFRNITPSQFKVDCDNLRRHLKFALPHAICPACGGNGCKLCARSGWVSEGTFEAYVPQDLK